MLPNGTYIGRGSGPLIWSDSPNGSPQVIVKLKATKGEYEGGTADFVSSLVGGALEITKRQLEALGFDGDDDNSVTKNEVSFRVFSENYNGKDQVRVQVLTGINYQAMSASDAIAAKARLKASIKSAAPKKTEEEPF